MTNTPRTSPRHAARRSATDEKIVTAVLDLMCSDGLRGVTIEAVSERAGVAKTTIYRRYADRNEMMRGVLTRLAPQAPDEPELSKQGLVDLLTQTREAFSGPVGLRVIGVILVGNDEMIKRWRDTLVDPYSQALRRYLTRGVEAGVLAADLDQSLVYEMIMGGLVMSETLSGHVDENWPQRVVDTLWPVMRG